MIYDYFLNLLYLSNLHVKIFFSKNMIMYLNYIKMTKTPLYFLFLYQNFLLFVFLDHYIFLTNLNFIYFVIFEN